MTEAIRGIEAVAQVASESKPLEVIEQPEDGLNQHLPNITPSNSSFSTNNMLELLGTRSSSSEQNGDNGLSSNKLVPTLSTSAFDTALMSTPSQEASNGQQDVSSGKSSEQPQVQPQQIVPSNSSTKQIATKATEGDKENFIDITEFLNLPQTEAAKKLGVPTSTLSKRWKEAAVNRKWPYRTVAKLDKEIMTLLHNIPQGPDAPPLPAEIEASLGILLRKRQDELRTVVIRL
eukprot:TRINITY_DN5173_c0_g1_i1.p1 TRINITY_DN5173_c0_g1~~TRINITY_DN5173_c0_g1_i1.p1  ORF type:complete len:233 (+),score=38.25 TRINITY_DN5173_c0_g1_i1:141-839(+)